MSDFEFPQINPEGPIPAPNTIHSGDRPGSRAGRELSAYGDQDYPESCLQASANDDSPARTGNAAYGNMREVEANPSDSAQFAS